MTEITSPADWKKSTDIVTLPSGNTVELRRTLPVHMLLRVGKITQEDVNAMERAKAGVLTDIGAAVRLIGVMCEAMFVTPRVTADGEAGTLALDEIDQADQDYIVERAFGGTPSAAFPAEQVRDDGGDGGEVLGKPAKRAPRPAKRQPARARS